jgi:hypothetical protein
MGCIWSMRRIIENSGTNHFSTGTILRKDLDLVVKVPGEAGKVPSVKNPGQRAV